MCVCVCLCVCLYVFVCVCGLNDYLNRNETVNLFFIDFLTVNGILAPDCYSECGIKHDWVCGSDGNSYQNPCQLTAYACEHPKENITIKHDTRCENIKGGKNIEDKSFL